MGGISRENASSGIWNKEQAGTRPKIQYNAARVKKEIVHRTVYSIRV
jgi:hypothetical protein